MDHSTIISLKSQVDSIYELFDFIEKVAGRPKDLDSSLREVFEHELLKVVLYFSASDGKISVHEKEFINELFDNRLTTKQLATLIEKANIYSTEFENDELLCLMILKRFDEKIISRGQEPSVPLIIDTMELIVKAFITSDNDVDDQEVEDFKIYFSNLREKYIDEEDAFLGRTFKKNSSSRINDNSLKDYYLKKKK